jgi:hypothetical protein
MYVDCKYHWSNIIETLLYCKKYSNRREKQRQSPKNITAMYSDFDIFNSKQLSWKYLWSNHKSLSSYNIEKISRSLVTMFRELIVSQNCNIKYSEISLGNRSISNLQKSVLQTNKMESKPYQIMDRKTFVKLFNNPLCIIY